MIQAKPRVGAARKRRQILVSFSGIDGAGKSTQITNLQENLAAAGLRVQLITFWDDVARFKRLREGAGQKLFKGDAGVGTPEAPIRRRDKNVRSPVMTLVRLGLYAADALSLRRITRRALDTEADVVIFDRYLYDELANLNLSNAFARAFVRMLLSWVPQPVIGFILDADPAQAFARKPEYPLDFLHANRAAYLQLSQLVPGMAVIRPMPLAEAEAEVVRYVMNHPELLQRLRFGS